MTLPEAIGRKEGFLVRGSRAQRNRNPGNIEFGKFARAHGATGSDGRFAIFPSVAAGFAALEALLATPAYSNLTIEEALPKYAPSSENDTAKYIADVCAWTGFDPRVLVGQVLKTTEPDATGFSG